MYLDRKRYSVGANKNLWKRRYDDDLSTSEGVVLGEGLANFKMENGKPDAAKNRLYRILITESVHLIWVLRCERRMNGGNSPQNYHMEEAVKAKWWGKMNKKMRINCLLTN